MKENEQTCLNCSWASWSIKDTDSRMLFKDQIEHFAKVGNAFMTSEQNYLMGGQCRWQYDSGVQIPKANFLGGGGVIHRVRPETDCPQWKGVTP